MYPSRGDLARIVIIDSLRGSRHRRDRLRRSVLDNEGNGGFRKRFAKPVVVVHTEFARATRQDTRERNAVRRADFSNRYERSPWNLRAKPGIRKREFYGVRGWFRWPQMRPREIN